MSETPKEEKPQPIVLDEWVEADLAARADAGELPEAFFVDDFIRQVEEVVLGGEGRCPVLVGPRGVGKTAVFHELVRRARVGDGLEALRSAPIVQIGLAGIAGRFPPQQVSGKATEFVQRLFDHLIAEPAVVLIRDIHAAYRFDWESILFRFLNRAKLPVLGEALPRPFDELIDYSDELAELLVAFPVEEPPPARIRELVDAWDTARTGEGERPFTADARETAVVLTGRYLGDRRFPRKALDLLRQTRLLAGTGSGEVSSAEVVRRFSDRTRVPQHLADPEAPLDLDEVHDFISERLLGQSEAVDALVRMIAHIKAGLTDLRRPFGVLFFVGPTGVGKTHAAQLLAEHLFGNRHRLIRINMGDFKEAAHAAALFGTPYGSLAERRGMLASRLVGHSFGVLLLDEFEKAHEAVHDRFLQLIDEGRFINGLGETISLTSTIVIATSNAGVEVYREAGLGFRKAPDLEALDAELDRRLLQTFRFEFLNRFDRIVHFHPLGRADIRRIARRELAQLVERDGLRTRRLELELSVEVLDWLVAHGYHPHFGARFLRREIERSVTTALADFLVRHRPPEGARLGLGVRSNRIRVERLDARPERLPVRLPEGEQRLYDPESLLAEVQRWRERFAEFERESAARAEEASVLIGESQAADFWDHGETAQGVLRRYKALDARLQADKRLLRPYRTLNDVLDGQRTPDLARLAALVEELAANHRRWLELGASDAARGAWLLVGPGDMQPSGEWLHELCSMYRGWFRRRGVNAEVVAEQVLANEVERAIFEVEGSGVLGLLAMEQGLHRRRAKGRSRRAQVDVVPRGQSAPERLPEGVVVEDARHGAGLLVERARARLRLSVPERGIDWSFVGADKDTMRLLARDLAEHMSGQPPAPEVARTYAVVGGAVRDPRTAATNPNLKEVLRGNLEAFLKAWER